jgi:predicted unusual protein kinase regulating ubiquinone biosynthesis (AarF/ABC1/UbiB family)
VREALRTADLVKNAQRLVATLGEMKGAAMKVGQMLSLQDAFLPPEVAVVLRSLQGETPSLPLDMVEAQLAEELGDPLQIFASFEPEAFAAASIGQVHRAVLRDGRRVAVKIQYPHIDRIVEADLEISTGS